MRAGSADARSLLRRQLLRPMRGGRVPVRVVLPLLALSLVCLLAAPLLMPEDYSWVANTTSESAAQGVPGAWLARLGFLSFGFAVVWIAAVGGPGWPRAAAWAHMAFGVSLVAAAAFSVRPWQPDVPYDRFEDTLHSVAATAVGLAFTLGVLLRLLQRAAQQAGGRGLDAVALAAAIGLPLLMAFQPATAGAAQRLMFLTAYVWYGREAWIGRDGRREHAAEYGEEARDDA